MLRRISLLLFFMMTAHWAKGQVDTLYSSSGDRLIGELKSMNRGVAVLKTKYSDKNFQIEWEDLSGIVVNRHHVIYLRDGSKLVGGIKVADLKSKEILLYSDRGEVIKHMDDIVQILAVEAQFWQRMYVSVDAGYSIQKANNVQQISANAHLKYQAPGWSVQGDYGQLGTTQDNVDPVDRIDGGVRFVVDVGGRSMTFLSAEFLSNNEQAIDFRVTGVIGYGYYFVRSMHLHWVGGAGAAYTYEDFGDDELSIDNSLEAAVIMQFNVYDYKDFSLLTQLSFYPGITNGGRLRLNTDIDLKYEFPFDLYIKFGFRDNFDNRPVSSGARNDYVFQTTIGWEWD